jgi:FkbM family methyltransferase
MGLGSFIIDRFGMRVRYMGFFERLIDIGASGLGHGQPFGSKAVEEHALQAVLSKIPSRPVTVFDVGANRGDYTELVLRVTREGQRRVFAFEPDKDVANELRSRFPGADGLAVVTKALSDAPGTARFFRQQRDRISSLHDASQKPQTHGPQVVKDVVEVELDSIDHFCSTNGIDRIDLLKVDTEGHDHLVLKGAARMITEGRIGAIQFEFSEMNITSGATFMMFWEQLSPGFDLYRMCKDGLYPIPRYNALRLELYYVVNFFAIAKGGA